MPGTSEYLPETPTFVVELLESARDGSRQALGRLLELLRPYLMRIAKQNLPKDLHVKQGPADSVQETCLEAHRDFSQFRGTTARELRAWLKRILLNNLANFAERYRRTAKRQVDLEVPLSEMDLELASTLSPSRVAGKREMEELLEAALNRLPDSYRRVILLRYRYQKSFEDIAWAMERSADAVRKLWSRALDRLKRELDDSAQ